MGRNQGNLVSSGPVIFIICRNYFETNSISKGMRNQSINEIPLSEPEAMGSSQGDLVPLWPGFLVREILKSTDIF